MDCLNYLFWFKFNQENIVEYKEMKWLQKIF